MTLVEINAAIAREERHLNEHRLALREAEAEGQDTARLRTMAGFVERRLAVLDEYRRSLFFLIEEPDELHELVAR